MSGAYTFSVTDLSVHGRGMNFTFTRTYNSADSWYGSSSFIGAGWIHSYDWELEDGTCASRFALRRGDGGRGIAPDDLSFGNDGAPYGSRTYTLVTRDHTTYTFGDALYHYADPEIPGPCDSWYHYLLKRISDPAGNAITFNYTVSGIVGEQQARLQTITDTLGRVYRFSYDAGGSVSRFDDPFGRSLLFSVNTIGQLTSFTDAAGKTWSYAYYGGYRWITSVTDPDGRIDPRNTYDTSNGRVTSQTDGQGYVTTVTFWNTNVYVKDPRGLETAYGTGSCGVLWENIYPYGMISYGYDGGCNRTSVVDRLGNQTDFTYARNRFVASRTDPAPAAGAPRPVTRYTYDGNWNLAQITDPRGFTTDRTYDPATFALLTERRQVDAATFATTTYTYGDAANKLLPTQIRSPQGGITTLVYDASANLTRKTDPDYITTTFGYDPRGRQTAVTDAEGRTTTTQYDNSDRVTVVTDPLLHSTTYAYDGAGNRTSVTDRNGSITRYLYDGNARLVRVEQKPDVNTTYATVLVRDGNGNVTRIIEGNGNDRDSAYDAFDRVISTTEYTSQGTLTTTYTRDVLGNVLSRTTPDGVTTSYTYDALSRLTAVSAPGLTINYA